MENTLNRIKKLQTEYKNLKRNGDLVEVGTDYVIVTSNVFYALLYKKGLQFVPTIKELHYNGIRYIMAD